MKRRLLLLAGLAALAGCPTNLGLKAGRLYECARDAGALADGGWLADGTEAQCPGGFHCGVEGYCHARDGGVPWRCESDVDCDLHWRCGQKGDGGLGVCQDTTVGQAYPCTPGDDSACEQGWRCGLSGQCHDPDASVPYPCLPNDDRWCERNWRCGPELLCVDPTAEALLPTPELDAGAERLSPRFTPGASSVSASAWSPTFPPAPGSPLGAVFGWASGAEVAASAASWFPSPFPSLPASSHLVFDGGAQVEVWSTGLFAAGGSTVVRQTFALGFFGMQASAPQVLSGFPGLVPTGLRVTEADGLLRRMAGRRLAAFNGAAVSVWDDDAGAVLALDQPGPDGGLTDLLLTDYGAMVAGTPTGLLWSPLDASAWTPFSAFGPGGADFAVLQLRAGRMPGTNVELIAVLARPLDGGAPLVTAMDVGGSSATGDPPLNAYAGPSLPSCEACPGGTPIDLLSPYTFSATARGLRVRCQTGSGQKIVQHSVTSAAGQLPVLACATLGTAALAGLDERSGFEEASLDALGFTHSPVLGSPVLSSPPRALVTTSQGRVALVDEPFAAGVMAAAFDPLLGFLMFSWGDAPQFPAPVEGREDLYVGEISQDVFVGTDAPTVRKAQLAASLDVLGGPFHATSRREDGGTSFYVTAFDTLFAGTVADGADGGLLSARAVPLVRQPIDSLTALPVAVGSDGGTHLHSGYLVAQGRMFRFESFSPQVWRSDELLLDQEAVAVWADAERGRVGLRDGTVRSLPGRVTVGPPLPSGEPVLQYAHVCGETFALAASGLSRLSLAADAGVIARWVDEPRLSPALAGVPAPWLGAHLLTTPNELIVTTATSVVARLQLDCR